MSPAVAPSASSIPDDASCLECGYSLRGLPSPRCPECGWQFDPADTELMDICRGRSKFGRGIMGPIPSWVRTLVLISCAAIVWGSALLPGSLTVEIYGWIVLACVTIYSIARRTIRASLRVQLFLPRQIRPASEHYTRWQLLIVALAVTSPIFALPLRINIFINRPLLDHLANHIYTVEPMIYPKPPPRFAGLFVFNRVSARYDGVALEVSGGGLLFWSAPAAGEPQGPYGAYGWFNIGGQFMVPYPLNGILQRSDRINILKELF